MADCVDPDEVAHPCYILLKLRWLDGRPCRSRWGSSWSASAGCMLFANSWFFFYFGTLSVEFWHIKISLCLDKPQVSREWIVTIYMYYTNVISIISIYFTQSTTRLNLWKNHIWMWRYGIYYTCTCTLFGQSLLTWTIWPQW